MSQSQSQYQFNQDLNDYTPPNKKMKYEPILIQFDVGFLLPSSKIYILGKNIKCYDYNEKYRPILHFQTVEGADIYLIGNMNKDNKDNIDNIDIIDLNKGYTLDEIYNYFINGKLHIGTNSHYNGIHKNPYFINNISELNHEDNSEIKLHYTTSKKNVNNVAWRTIQWDLFSDYVPQFAFYNYN